MAEEDEDVVFENSALHHHLKNVGFEEDDVVPEKRNLQLELDNSERQDYTENQGTDDFIQTAVVKPKSNFFWNVFRETRKQVELKHGKLFYCNLLPNNALEAEDRSFLVNFIEDEDLSLEQSVPNRLWWIRPVSVLVLLSSYLVLRICFPMVLSLPFPVIVSDLVILILVVFGLGLGPATFLAKQWYEVKCQQEVVAMNETVDCLRSLKATGRKAVRLIQETELVTRGFTLVAHTAPLPWLEKGSGSQRQCPELRKVLFSTCRSMLLLSRQTTLKFIQQHQVVGEVLEGGSYLAHIPLEEYGALIVAESEEDIKNATDNYSIAAIKAVFQLQNWYMSEMLKRVALGLLLQQNANPDSSVVYVSAEILCGIRGEVQKLLDTLKMCYKLHQCAVSDSDLNDEPKNTAPKSHASNVYTAVHSLNLHLQAALKKVQKMEEKLEPISSEEDCDGFIVSPIKEAMVLEFTQLQADLDSCMDCVEEGVSRLEKKEYPPRPEAQPTVQEPAEEPESTESVPLLEIGDPIIEDQVFEAYTDPNEVEEEHYDLELLFSEEERARRRLERKNAKRVIRELNNRIAVQSWERDCNKKRETGEEVNEKPPQPVADFAEEEDEEVDFPKKKNPYASVLSEYEKQWKEMDTVLRQNTDLSKDNVAEVGDVSSVPFTVEEIGSATDLVESDEMKTVTEGGEGMPLSKPSQGDDLTNDSDALAASVHGGDAPSQINSQNDNSEEQSALDDFGDHSSVQPDSELRGPESERLETRDSESLSVLKQKLQHLPGVGFGFSANVAALASQRSQQMGLVMDTFGDSDDEEISDQT